MINNIFTDSLPWETYLQLGDIQRPLGLTLNESIPGHYHFAVGYLCLHSFMYEEAREAFDLAIEKNSSLVEAYIGKLLACKQPLWSYTDFNCSNTTIMLIENRTKAVNLSSLQRDLIITAQQWYINSSSTSVGELAFLSHITNLTQKYSNNTDLLAWKALSLLNTAEQRQNQNIMEPSEVIQARTVLNEILQKEPNHPGALHYMIHAYDVAQVDIASKAQDFARRYGEIAKTASHGQHMPSHIWIRMGLWNEVDSADTAALIASYSLCATKILNSIQNVTSIRLRPALELVNKTSATNSSLRLLQCDAENRAHSLEWLAYSKLQTGDWTGSLELLQDLYESYNRTATIMEHYLSFAYRTQARTIIEMFHWFPYRFQFKNQTDKILMAKGNSNVITVLNGSTSWYPLWSEAGFRFSECLRLLAISNNTYNSSIINDHITRIEALADLTSSNRYVSNVISTMILQIRGIRAYVNQSFQECLNELSKAQISESLVQPDASSPTLVFGRSADLLATHLLLIYDKLQQGVKSRLATRYQLHGLELENSTLLTHALNLYQSTSSIIANRSINLLGMARAHTKLGNTAEARKLYQRLLSQMNSSNLTDPTFTQEITNSLNQLPLYNSAAISSFTLLLFILSFVILRIL